MTSIRIEPAVSLSISPKPRRFSTVAIALHWLTVVLVVGLFASAWGLTLAGEYGWFDQLLTLHRSIGVLAWATAIGRLVWRFGFAPPPPWPPTMSRPQQAAAKFSEWGLYLILIAQPLMGLGQSLTRGRPFQLLVWTVPPLMARDKPLTALVHQAHALTAWVLLGLIILHILAAAFHRFVLRDEVFQSMAPWKPRLRRVKTTRSGAHAA